MIEAVSSIVPVNADSMNPASILSMSNGLQDQDAVLAADSIVLRISVNPSTL